MHSICVVFISSLISCFFNDSATTEIYTLSLHDALPIYVDDEKVSATFKKGVLVIELPKKPDAPAKGRSIPIG